jgi:hypothetical protein
MRKVQCTKIPIPATSAIFIDHFMGGSLFDSVQERLSELFSFDRIRSHFASDVDDQGERAEIGRCDQKLATFAFGDFGFALSLSLMDESRPCETSGHESLAACTVREVNPQLATN